MDTNFDRLNFLEFCRLEEIKFLRKTAVTLLAVDQNRSVTYQVKLTRGENRTKLFNLTLKLLANKN